MSLNLALWVVYLVFAAAALAAGCHPRLLAFDGPLGGAKLAIWLAWAAFLAYSLYCSSRESLFRTARAIVEYHWGRQIGIDLYLGLGLALLVIGLHEGPLVAALWLLPTLAFANLAILLWFAIHFDAVVARFLA